MWGSGSAAIAVAAGVIIALGVFPLSVITPLALLALPLLALLAWRLRATVGRPDEAEAERPAGPSEGEPLGGGGRPRHQRRIAGGMISDRHRAPPR